jgi:hypothetical protein
VKECYIGREAYETRDTMKTRISTTTMKSDDPQVLTSLTVSAYGGLLRHDVQIRLSLWIFVCFFLHCSVCLDALCWLYEGKPMNRETKVKLSCRSSEMTMLKIIDGLTD